MTFSDYDSGPVRPEKSRASKVGELVVELSVDTTKFDQGLARARKALGEPRFIRSDNVVVRIDELESAQMTGSSEGKPVLRLEFRSDIARVYYGDNALALFAELNRHMSEPRT